MRGRLLATSRVLLATACLWAGGSGAAEAQQRPLVTEDPETVGEGQVLVEAGVEWGWDVRYPVSGLAGDRIVVPVGMSLGLGPRVELQIDSGYNWLDIQSRFEAPLAERVPSDLGATSDAVDAVLATKIRILSEGRRRPALGVRFATKLPNASNERGLGTDTIDFFATFLAGKTAGWFRVVSNVGVGFITSPLAGSLQQDAFVASLSVARGFTESLEIVAELAGQKVLFADVPPVGAEPRGALRATARYTAGSWRFDGGVVVGLTDQDPDFGLSAGVTWAGAAFP